MRRPGVAPGWHWTLLGQLLAIPRALGLLTGRVDIFPDHSLIFSIRFTGVKDHHSLTDGDIKEPDPSFLGIACLLLTGDILILRHGSRCLLLWRAGGYCEVRMPLNVLFCLGAQPSPGTPGA